MTDHVYRVTEIVGSSPESLRRGDPQRASRGQVETLRNLDWFEVTEIRGHVHGRRRSRTSRSG